MKHWVTSSAVCFSNVNKTQKQFPEIILVTTSERNGKNEQKMEQSSHNTEKSLLDSSYHTGSGNFYSRLCCEGSLMSVH